jgi:hypothetical protein
MTGCVSVPPSITAASRLQDGSDTRNERRDKR